MKRSHLKNKLFLLYVVTCIVCAGVDLAYKNETALFVSSVIYSILSFIIVRAEALGDPLRITPIVCYQSWLGLTVGIAGFGTAWMYSDGMPIEMGFHVIEINEAAKGHAILIIGFCAFVGGYEISRRQWRSEQGKKHSSASVPVILMYFFFGLAVTLASRVLTSVVGSAIVSPLAAMMQGAACMYAINPPQHIEQKKTLHQGSVLLLCFIQLFIALRGDSKMTIMFSGMPILWLMVISAKNKIKLPIVFSLVSLVYLGIVVPLVNQTRFQSSGENVANRRVWNEENLTNVPELLRFDGNTVNRVAEHVPFTLRRMAEFVEAGIITRITDDEGYGGWKEASYLWMSFIPRAIWPEKPISNRGGWFSERLGFATSAETATSSTGMTSPGELYWFWGWSGVVLGMLLLGWLFSAFWVQETGPDPRGGMLQMTSYVAACLSPILMVGAAWGPALVGCGTWGGILYTARKLRLK